MQKTVTGHQSRAWLQIWKEPAPWHAVAGEHAGGVGDDRRVAVGQQGHLLVWRPVQGEEECLRTVRVLWWWAAWACIVELGMHWSKGLSAASVLPHGMNGALKP